MIDYWIKLVTAYPDAMSVLIGCALSWMPGLVLETWFLPEEWPARKMKQVTLSVTIVIAFVVSTVLWHSLDVADSKTVVGIISFAAALGAPFVHMFAAAVLTHFFPYLDSVFKFKPRTGDGK